MTTPLSKITSSSSSTSSTDSSFQPRFITYPIAPQKRPYGLETDSYDDPLTLPISPTFRPPKRLRLTGSFHPRIHPGPLRARRSSLPARPPRYLFTGSIPLKRRRSLPNIKCTYKRQQSSRIEFLPMTFSEEPEELSKPVIELVANQPRASTWPAIRPRTRESKFLKRERRRHSNALRRVSIAGCERRRCEAPVKSALTEQQEPMEVPSVPVEETGNCSEKETIIEKKSTTLPEEPLATKPTGAAESSLMTRLRGRMGLFKAAKENLGEKVKRLAASTTKEKEKDESQHKDSKKLGTAKPRKPMVESDTEGEDEERRKEKKETKKKLSFRKKSKTVEKKEKVESGNSSDSETEVENTTKTSKLRLKSKKSEKQEKSSKDKVKKVVGNKEDESGETKKSDEPATPKDAVMKDTSEAEADSEKETTSESSDSESVKTAKTKKKKSAKTKETEPEASSTMESKSGNSSFSSTPESVEHDVEMLSIIDDASSETSTIVDIDMSGDDDADTIVNVERDVAEKTAPDIDSTDKEGKGATSRTEETRNTETELPKSEPEAIKSKSKGGIREEKFSTPPLMIHTTEPKKDKAVIHNSLPTPPDTPASAKSISPSHVYTWKHTTHFPLETKQITPRSFNLATELLDTNAAVEEVKADSSSLSEETGQSHSVSGPLRTRLSAIFSQTLKRTRNIFNPRNISRHAYRDNASYSSLSREDDDDLDTELDPYESLPSPPLDWYHCYPESTSQVVEQLERFTMAC